ncbi:fibronectin type III domain-containing protein [Candidatus Enterococcus mansonii]|uniref:Fibronectin type-III domain-containing protein n=1 Tax=Candidatus Enterococcus mansonii TaxID=1834181 RepID=A0A242CHI1_9ENTE|nr:fibronectin type III domain-containing protein [Enterococcus sp. 4G2_DIV0659]OTO09370.1 hypothetical protein A5880_000049 [Enterococcus sp. 4G2_DIV0659]
MKKNIRLLFLCVIIVMIFPNDWSYALEIKQLEEDTTESISSSEQETILESTETTDAELSDSSTATSEEQESEESEKTTENIDKIELNEQDKVEINNKNILKIDDRQDAEGFWLVDSAETLMEYLKDNEKLKFRLTNNINLGSAGYKLKNNVIIDGGGHIITYNKAGVAASGFYVNETNAVIEIRNTQFGNSDGSGADGFYGVVTGITAANMTFIFDNVDYYSTNGQMIYNIDGSVIMRGQNTIDQRGTNTYSQEWAEINYVEIQSGQTSIKHSGTTDAFIWSAGIAAGNPHARTSQIVVRENARLDVQTNGNVMYGTFAPSYIVEKNGIFNLDKVTLATTSTKNRFFGNNLTQPVNFDFQEQSQVNFTLPLPINLNTAKGGMNIGEHADVSIDVASGTAFSTATSSSFAVNMTKSKKVSFSSNSLGTLGLNGGTGVKNLAFSSNYLQKIETFSNKTNTTPTREIFKEASELSVQGTNFTNVVDSINPFSAQEIQALKNSQKIVFSEFIDIPDQLTLIAAANNDMSVSLYGSSVNNGSSALEVKFFLFTDKQDINDLRKAKHIVTLDSFEEQENTSLNSYYHVTVDGLNPNTNYWAQMVVINQAGESEFSDVSLFATKPQLEKMKANVTTTSAIVSGELASDTGKWTDYTNGEDLGIPDQSSYYGGIYQQVKVEYSKNKAFPANETKSQIADLSGEKNQYFTTKLTGLEGDVTYYVRVKVMGVSGGEVTLAMTPLTEFQTVTEIIKVEVPIEMAFQTKNKDIGTTKEGEITSTEYQVINKGNTPTKISINNLTNENVDASQLLLLDTLAGKQNHDELALQMLVDNDQANPLFLTNDLSNNPLSLGVLKADEKKHLRLNGKYFNPNAAAKFPTYKMTFKVERNEE